MAGFVFEEGWYEGAGGSFTQTGFLDGGAAASPVVTLSGTVASVSTVAASATAVRGLSGSAAGDSTVASFVRAVRGLSGSVAGDSTVAASATAVRRLGGSAACDSTVAASATAVRGLSGAVAGVSTVVAGTLRMILSLTGLVDNSTTVSADLSGGAEVPDGPDSLTASFLYWWRRVRRRWISGTQT